MHIYVRELNTFYENKVKGLSVIMKGKKVCKLEIKYFRDWNFVQL